MIDLHNHILFGLDDGASDIDESLAIARQFVSEGVHEIAATPHLDPENHRGADADFVRQRLEEVQAALAEAQIPLTVWQGHELYLTPDADDLLRDGKAAALGSGSGVLIEVSMVTPQKPLYLDDTVFRLQLAGYTPILGHPERYGFVQQRVGALDDLIERGLLLQLTAPALLGEYGSAVRRTAEALLRRGSYALAASDRHHPGPNRSLVSLRERIEAMVGPDTAHLLLTENPRRILGGRSVQPIPRAQHEEASFLTRLLGRKTR